METDARPINSILKVGDLVHEAGGEHETPARIIEVIKKHGRTYYRVHFKNRSILNKIILPDYRLVKYKTMENKTDGNKIGPAVRTTESSFKILD